VQGADLPLELGVLIDASSSQRSADLNDILKAAKQFVSEAIHGEDDRVFILQFAATPHATGWLTREQLQSAPVKASIGGGTALYDAVAMACKERMGPIDRQKPVARRILVLISDGEDNRSHVTHEVAASEALRAGAVVFTIDTDLSRMSYRGLRIMERLAEVTVSLSIRSAANKFQESLPASRK
jgi:Ca-activated chloride channel family protein